MSYSILNSLIYTAVWTEKQESTHIKSMLSPLVCIRIYSYVFVLCGHICEYFSFFNVISYKMWFFENALYFMSFFYTFFLVLSNCPKFCTILYIEVNKDMKIFSSNVNVLHRRNEEYSLVSPVMWHFGHAFVNLFYLFGSVDHFYLQQMSINPLTEVQCV